MIAVLTFLRSPFGRYLMIGVAIVIMVASIRHAGYSAGIKHERQASASKIASISASLTTCQENGRGMAVQIDRINAATALVQAESDRRVSQATSALQQAQKGRASAEARAAKLLAHPPAGIDACARMESADAAVLEAIK